MDTLNSSFKPKSSMAIEISSDEDEDMETKNEEMVPEISSDEEDINSTLNRELPNVSNSDNNSNERHVQIAKEKAKAIRNLFPSIKSEKIIEKSSTVPTVWNRMVAGVEFKLPVKPYASQIALMHTLVKSIKESKNCILESPTGTGKTLALLCAVLAWQEHEKNTKAQEKERQEAVLTENLSIYNCTHSPSTSKQPQAVTPEKLFTKQNFGEKNIYQKVEVKAEVPSPNYKRSGPYMETAEEEASTAGLVNIHKKARHLDRGDNPEVSIVNQQVTPEKSTQAANKETPESLRKLYDEIIGLHFHRVPTIYYGARTHTQLQQVIKEFKRTAYCGQAKMTILSSRDKTCIKRLETDRWSSKDDMCRSCVKSSKNSRSNCEFYDNRRDLTHKTLPHAFDLEDLVSLGQEKKACPYFGARHLANNADIIFCPYNYLIDPAIRSSMQIDLQDSIIVIDEAHNIESVCREAATYSFTQKQVQIALKELQTVAGFRFQTRDLERYIDTLVSTLRGWDDWFNNQIPLLKSKPANNKKVTYDWDVREFVQTLENHNIGYSRLGSFKSSSEVFCRRLREDPRTLLGVTQVTGGLLESLSIVMGYLFRDEQKHIDDFKPALEADVSDFYKERTIDKITLKLHCLNSAIVMSSLHVARCIALASGTLSPMGAIDAELGTPFPMTISKCITPQDKVWVGVVKGDNNACQEYKFLDLEQPSTKDRFGNVVERVCKLTPNGVLCFVNSYPTLANLIRRWKFTGLWTNLNMMKSVFIEQRSASDHEDTMKDFYEKVVTKKGALLLAVYRGKVSEGMDFKDHQARAVICMSIPYPSPFDIAVKAKMDYNEKYRERGLLGKKDWMQIQAYRALNQALGRCVRHQEDWGAVLLVDSRYSRAEYTEPLSKWVHTILNRQPYTYETLESREDGLASFMERMKIHEEENGIN